MGPVWTQFRRLLLGTVIELVQEAGVPMQGAVAIRFDADSRFDVPRLNNYMRFVGEVTVGLASEPEAAAITRLRTALVGVWGELLAVVDLPIGDRLTSTRNDTSVELRGRTLVVRFDLVAD